MPIAAAATHSVLLPLCDGPGTITIPFVVASTAAWIATRPLNRSAVKTATSDSTRFQPPGAGSPSTRTEGSDAPRVADDDALHHRPGGPGLGPPKTASGHHKLPAKGHGSVDGDLDDRAVVGDAPLGDAPVGVYSWVSTGTAGRYLPRSPPFVTCPDPRPRALSIHRPFVPSGGPICTGFGM